MPLVYIVSCPESDLLNSIKESLYSTNNSNLEKLSPNWRVVGNKNNGSGFFITVSLPLSPSKVIRYPDAYKSPPTVKNKLFPNYIK